MSGLIRNRLFIFWHFIGSSLDSTAVKELLQRLCEELKAQFPLALGQREVAGDEDTLIRTLPDWLASVPERIVVIIDGLNQLFEKEQRLTWLPTFVSPHVRLVVSTVAGIALEQLQSRDWPLFTLALLDETQRRELVETSLQKSGKALKLDQLDLIVQAEYAANPLYLKVLLRELAIEGQHRTLGEQIQAYLEAHDLTALYDQVLVRFEKYRSRETMTRVWSALWATRWGLTEEELLALSGLSKLEWATLSAGLLDVVALVNRDGLLNFYHQYVQEAVAKRYVGTVELQQAAHRTLADYFAQQELNKRIANLLPYHWFMAGDKVALKVCIGQITIMSYHTDKYELLSYWREVADYEEMESTYVWAFFRIGWQTRWLAILRFLRLSKCYPPYWNLRKLASLLQTAGRYGYVTTVLHNRLVKTNTKQYGQDSTEIAVSFNNLAALYRA